MTSGMQAAKKICELSEWSVSNLRLQKILYIAHMMYLGENRVPLIEDEQFQAWDYGPVLPTLYHQAKKYRNEPIQSDCFDGVQDIAEQSKTEELKRAWDALEDKSTYSLVDFTHLKGGAWQRNYSRVFRPASISDKDILQEFEMFMKG